MKTEQQQLPLTAESCFHPHGYQTALQGDEAKSVFLNIKKIVCVSNYIHHLNIALCVHHHPKFFNNPRHSAASSTKAYLNPLDTALISYLFCVPDPTLQHLDRLCFTFAASFRWVYLPRPSTVYSTASFPTELYVHRVLEKHPPRPTYETVPTGERPFGPCFPLSFQKSQRAHWTGWRIMKHMALCCFSSRRITALTCLTSILWYRLYRSNLLIGVSPQTRLQPHVPTPWHVNLRHGT